MGKWSSLFLVFMSWFWTVYLVFWIGVSDMVTAITWQLTIIVFMLWEIREAIVESR